MQPEELPADGSTPGFVAMVGDMTQTYGATSHCEVTTYAAAKREQRFRPMRKTRQADAFRSTCLKFVNLDDHGSGVGYESSIPSLPQPGTIAEEKLNEIRKTLTTWEPPEVTCSFARGGCVSVVCYSKIDTDRTAPWEGLNEKQMAFLRPKLMTDKGGRRKSTSDDGGNIHSDARLILNFYVRSRALARWASARRKIKAWRSLMGGFGSLEGGIGAAKPPTRGAVAKGSRRMSTSTMAADAAKNAEVSTVLTWPQHKFIEKEIVKFLKKLSGVYGIVLIDVERRHMFACRDPQGTVQLHLASTPDQCVVCATEAKLLPAKLKETRTISPGMYVYGTLEDIMKPGSEEALKVDTN